MLYVKLDIYYMKEEEFTETMRQVLWDNWPNKKTFGSSPADIKIKDGWSWQEERLTYEEAFNLQRAGFKMTLEAHSEATQITKMQGEELRPWAGAKPSPSDMLDGRAVQITIPDLGLMLIDEVSHENDCCTDYLQQLLDRGWRILAVCPPCAQRRPDYILGRRKQKND